MPGPPPRPDGSPSTGTGAAKYSSPTIRMQRATRRFSKLTGWWKTPFGGQPPRLASPRLAQRQTSKITASLSTAARHAPRRAGGCGLVPRLLCARCPGRHPRCEALGPGGRPRGAPRGTSDVLPERIVKLSDRGSYAARRYLPAGRGERLHTALPAKSPRSQET